LTELKRNTKILTIRDNLFWDIDTRSLNPDRSIKLVVERIFTRGNENEFYGLLNFYTELEIKNAIVGIGYLDHITLNFASKLLGIPLDNFLCYKKEQLNNIRWNS